jgi:HSP20 family protein
MREFEYEYEYEIEDVNLNIRRKTPMAETTVQTRDDKAAELSPTRESARYASPAVDIYETGEGLTVVADLPGVESDALAVHVEDNVLSIEGKSKYERRGSPVADEFTIPAYFRQFELTDEVDRTKIHAELKNGVLTLHLPRAEKTMPRRIEVRTA